MSDSELLELAAKAAGIKIVGKKPDRHAQIINVGDEFHEHERDYPFKDLRGWNPLTYGESALRLVSTLKLNISFEQDQVFVSGGSFCVYEDFGENDLADAVQMAITRCAAEIGRSM